MMKLGNLLEEVKIGTEKYKELKTIEQIRENFNEDEEAYKISDLLNLHLQNLVSENADEKLIKKIKTAMLKVDSIEQRQEKTNYLSESYSRMKFDSLKTAYNDVIALMENKKISKHVDKEVIANSLGLIKYKINEMGKLCGVQPSLNEGNETFQPFIDKEYKTIRQAMD